LFIPQIATSEVASESDIFSHLCIQRALSVLEQSFFYVWLRRGDENWYKEAPGRACFYEDARMGFYGQMAAVDIARLFDLFSWQTGVFPIDVVFTSRSGVAPLLSVALADMGCQYPVPIVLTEPRVYGPGEQGHNTVNPVQLAVRAAGYAVCYGIYWSRWEKEAALNAAEQYVQPGVLKDWESRSFVVDALVDVDAAAQSIHKSETEKRMLFAGRLNSNKRYKDVIDAYGRVLMARRGDVEVWVHSGTGAFGKLGPPGEHRWHRTSERLDRDKYWELIGSSHLGAYMSYDEGANVTVQELIACGLVMVLPDKPWVHKLFYPLEYPYLVKSLKELPAMLDWLLDNFQTGYAAMQPFRELIARERSWPAFVRKFGHLYDAVRTVARPKAYRMFRKIAADAVGANRVGVPFSSLVALTRQWHHGMPALAEARGTYACYQAVRDMDDLATSDPFILRPEDAHGRDTTDDEAAADSDQQDRSG